MQDFFIFIFQIVNCNAELDNLLSSLDSGTYSIKVKQYNLDFSLLTEIIKKNQDLSIDLDLTWCTDKVSVMDLSNLDNLVGIQFPNVSFTIGASSNGGALSNNSGLTELRISPNVGNIYNSIQNCTNLTTVYCERTEPPLIGQSFKGCSQLSVIYVPSEAVESYKNATSWSDYADIIQAIP